MQSSNYQENLFSTTNPKLAAALLLFGFRLNHPSQPLEWSLEYPSKEAYIKSRKDPKIKPVEKVAWIFSYCPTRPADIFRDFNSKDSEQKLEQVLDKWVTDPKAKLEIKAAHSANVVQCCREVLEAREYLMSILKLVPRLAKPIVVFGKGTQFAKFGGNASKETQITHLDNL